MTLSETATSAVAATTTEATPVLQTERRDGIEYLIHNTPDDDVTA